MLAERVMLAAEPQIADTGLGPRFASKQQCSRNPPTNRIVTLGPSRAAAGFFGTSLAPASFLRFKVLGAAKLSFLLFAAVCPLIGQVSPGPLSKSHKSLDGTLKCASCHVFGAGSPKLKCLACHNEIRALVRQREGYHGRVVDRAKDDQDCARCHTEHYGEDFRIYKWETSKEEFDHRQTGYPLLGRHSGLRCEQCHNAKHISQADRRQIKVSDLNKTFEGDRKSVV